MDARNHERESGSLFSKAYENLVPEVVRKTVLMGLGGVAITEEGIRRLLSDLRLPRDEARKVMEYAIAQSQKSKKELVGLVTAEVKGFLKGLDLEEIVRQAMTGMKVKIQTEISFEPAEDGSATPQIEFETSVHPPPEPEDGSSLPVVSSSS